VGRGVEEGVHQLRGLEGGREAQVELPGGLEGRGELGEGRGEAGERQSKLVGETAEEVGCSCSEEAVELCREVVELYKELGGVVVGVEGRMWAGGVLWVPEGRRGVQN